MQTTKRKKLEIIVEVLVLRRVEGFLVEAGVRGWTVLPSLAGASASGEWRSGDFVPGQEKCLIMAIATEDVAACALDKLSAFFADYPGVVCISEVEVIRSDRF